MCHDWEAMRDTIQFLTKWIVQVHILHVGVFEAVLVLVAGHSRKQY